MTNDCTRELRVGFLGPRGTYSEEMARRFFAAGADLQAFGSIDAVIRAVDSGEVNTGVVPIENSLEGSVNATLDMLAHEVALFITGEIDMPIRHNLLALCTPAAVRVILSHPQALAQCRRTLTSAYPEAEFITVDSTAEAARLAACRGNGTAAVGSLSAAKIYHLRVIDENVQDFAANSTRFVTLSRQPGKTDGPGKYKTSVVCQINGERPGSLCGILQEIADREVNLIKIESRPARTGLGNYIFFLDMEGNVADEKIRSALAAVDAKSLWFKMLGSYQVQPWQI